MRNIVLMGKKSYGEIFYGKKSWKLYASENAENLDDLTTAYFNIVKLGTIQ